MFWLLEVFLFWGNFYFLDFHYLEHRLFLLRILMWVRLWRNHHHFVQFRPEILCSNFHYFSSTGTLENWKINFLRFGTLAFCCEKDSELMKLLEKSSQRRFVERTTCQIWTWSDAQLERYEKILFWEVMAVMENVFQHIY